MSLEDEVTQNRRSIRSDGYSMSIGEMLNLYRDKEIQIRPEFQRLFRWTLEKQSRLIESILLDIPLPAVFVAQRDDAIWEVVDGLQRLSTILKFMGELRNEETGATEEPSRLTRTKYLPSLEGLLYEDLPNPVKIQLKRAKLDFKILLRESDDSVKYELFDRLNSGGMRTSPQEVRTALLIMANPSVHTALQSLRRSEAVTNSLALTDRQTDEQYDLELLVRFLVFNTSTRDQLSSFADIDTFLTDRLLDLATPDADLTPELDVVRGTFEVAAAMGPNLFRKFDSGRDKPIGPFSVSAYEAITAGIAADLGGWRGVPEQDREGLLSAKVKELWTDPTFLRYSGAGIRATTRAPQMPEVGTRLFVAV